MAERNLKVVRLIEPELCLECRFAQMAEVQLKNGETQKMIHCRRLDCDNWDYQSAEDASDLQVDDAA